MYGAKDSQPIMLFKWNSKKNFFDKIVPETDY